MSATRSNARKRPMVIVVPPEAVRVLEDGDTVADPGVWYGQVGSVQYQSTISREAIVAGPPWTPSQPLPLGLHRAEEIARAVLAESLPDHQCWTSSEITLQRLRECEPERWFFVVGFVRETGRSSQQGVIQIPVTFTGLVGTVKKARGK